MAGAVRLQLRATSTWRWWAIGAFATGWLLAVTAVAWPLDDLSTRGSLSTHVVQHIVLGDLAAPLLLIGLPPAVGSLLDTWYRRALSGASRRAHATRLALSPLGALVVWSLVTYIWLVPPVHRLAVDAGLPHVLDHVSFLVLGMLVWLAAFDVRRGLEVRDWASLKAALVRCDLPWWARHAYAMVSRVAMLPAVALLWLAPTAAYYLTSEPPPGALGQREDQVRAASLMLGFEILLSGLAVVLAFIWVSVSEGRARDRQRGA